MSNRVFLSRIALILAMMLLLVLGTTVHAQSGTLRVGINAPVKLDPALGSADSEIMFNRTFTTI